ncbi:MAG: CHAT domain-containing protein, partial [Bacteroidetes bacterium]|nr:CHAT domain-containing protein [Bacteroidota bacterium]
YMKALDIKEENKDEKGISNCLNALGAVNKAMGEYPKAEQYYKKCLLIRESLNDSVGIADLYNNMCTLYKSQGNYKKALSYGQKGLELVKVFDNSDDPDRLISLYSNMGILYHFLGEDSLSEMYFQYSLDEAIKSIDSISIATGYTHFGVNYCESNNFQAADSNYRKAMEILEKFPNKRAFSTLYNNMGDLAAVQGKDIEALEWYKKSISLKQELNERANLANYYPSLAKAYLRTGDKLQCREILVKSMKMQRKLLKENFSVLSESEKAMFLKQATIVFEKFNDFALAHAEETDTLQGLCYNNSLLLNGLLLNSTREILEAAENNQDSTMKLAFWQLKQLREEISNLQSMPADKKEGNLENLELRANALEEELVRKSVSFARLYRQFDFQWTDVQKVLGQGEVAIEFVKIRHAMILQESLKADSFSYAALIIRPGMKTPAFVPLCSSNELAQLTDRSSTDDLRYVDRVYDPQGETLLYNLIWKPMENQLKDAKTVYFAPAGMLHQVSFAGIPVSGGKLLSDKFSLQRVSGTSVLLEGERNDKIKVKNALIYGGIDFTGFPEEIRNTVSSGDGFTWQFLEASLVEASVIEKILKKSGTNVSFLSGKKASEESFRAASGNSAPDVIHFATHGFTFPDPEKGSEDLLFENSFVMNLDPLFRTGLLFAGANLTWNGRHVPEGKEDGVLTAFEVANQNLRNTRLVVMSACETGMGHISGSEGVYGLQRAFKMAGVKYIVMSLWAVPDEQTAELMSLFYSKLASGETIRKSFVAAQNEMKKKYAAYFWAGFVLIE